jgi:hypothetical protein
VSLNLSLEPNFMPVVLRALEACSNSRHRQLFQTTTADMASVMVGPDSAEQKL